MNENPNKTPRLHLILIVAISLLIGYYFGVNKVAMDWKNYKPVLSVRSKEPPPGFVAIDFTPFWTVWQKLEESYYDKSKLDSQKMLNGAISGMVKTLDDPFTIYLPPSQNDDFKQGLAGQFQGIGAELGMENQRIIVISPIKDSPAARAGIRAGDAILKVNTQPTDKWTLSEAVEKIRGPRGTEVTLTILHKDQKSPQDIKIKRDIITVKSADGYVKAARDIKNIKVASDAKVAYLSLSQFGDHTNEEWVTLIGKLSKQINDDSQVRGVILDLRNNPGGYLTDAVFIASEFLSEGTPVVLEEDGSLQRITLKTNRPGALTKVPLIVLINKGSASASEIVAGALKDNGRAKLVGEVSYGKGTIQQAEDLGNGAGVHVTIAKWLTPQGAWVNGKGLTPDIEVKLNLKEPTRDTQLEKAVLELIK